MDKEVTIILTTPEAIMWRDYQQFHAAFALLVSRGIFDVKNGSVTIHFDSLGNIAKIERKDNLFDLRAKA